LPAGRAVDTDNNQMSSMGSDKPTQINLGQLSKTNLRTAGAVRHLTGAKIVVEYDVAGGAPNSVAIVLADGKRLTEDDKQNLLQLDSKLKKIEKTFGRSDNDTEILKIAFNYGGGINSVLSNMARAASSIDNRLTNMNRFLEFMGTCADIDDGATGSALANMIRTQAGRAIAASHAFLTETASSPSLPKEPAFMAAHHVTEWFRRTVFTETVIDLTRKTELIKMLVYPRPLYFSKAEVAIPEIANLLNFGTVPMPFPSLELMLEFATAEEKKQFESKASAEDKLAVENGFQLPILFLHDLVSQLGKCKAADLIRVSTYGDPHPKTPGKIAMRDFMRSMGLGLLVGAFTKSPADQQELGRAVGFVVPAAKDISVVSDFADIFKANADKAEDFRAYLTDVADGGKRKRLFDIGIIQCTETCSIEQRAKIRAAALKHLAETVKPYLAAGRKPEGWRDWLKQRRSAAAVRPRESGETNQRV